MAGDTKLRPKFESSQVKVMAVGSDAQIGYPIRQVVSYCTHSNFRYTFIITDRELVAIRVTITPTGSGIALDRPRRENLGHAPHHSAGTNMTDISSTLMSVSTTDTSGSYRTTAATDTPMVEYKSIPWGNHGDGKRHLTVFLALFYMAWLAGVGNSNLQFEYPSLDSCWPTISGNRFQHNSMGVKSKTPMADLEFPDPTADRNPKWLTFPDADGTPIQVMTFQSAVLQDVVRKDGVYHRQYIFTRTDPVEWGEDGEPTRFEETQIPILLNADVLVYDQPSDKVGYFVGLGWVDGYPVSSASTKRARVPSVSTGESSRYGESKKYGKYGESSKRSRK